MFEIIKGILNYCKNDKKGFDYIFRDAENEITNAEQQLERSRRAEHVFIQLQKDDRKKIKELTEENEALKKECERLKSLEPNISAEVESRIRLLRAQDRQEINGLIERNKKLIADRDVRITKNRELKEDNERLKEENKMLIHACERFKYFERGCSELKSGLKQLLDLN